MTDRLLAIYNPESGSADLGAIKKAFAKHEVDYLPVSSEDLTRRIKEATGPIVAAGGDGTIRSVAQHMVGTSQKLGIIPAGTLNHFAKALSVPLDPTKAAQLILKGTARRVDVGSVNDHVFINNSSIGFYPRSLRFREEYQKSIGKWPAAALGVLRSIFHPRHYYVEIHINGVLRTFRTPFVFIGNNEYQRSGSELGERATLEGGQLAVYVLKATTPLAIISSLIRTFLTRRRHTHDFAIYLTDSCTIHTKHHRSLNVACDGEAFRLATPLRYTSHHRALHVITKKGES